MKVGDLRPVDVPVIRCEDCAAPYKLEVPLFIFGEREPEYVYMRTCKHKDRAKVGDEHMEFALLSVARLRKAKR